MVSHVPLTAILSSGNVAALRTNYEWGRGDPNPHALRHMILSHARLPIPTLPHEYGTQFSRRGHLLTLSYDGYTVFPHAGGWQGMVAYLNTYQFYQKVSRSRRKKRDRGSGWYVLSLTRVVLTLRRWTGTPRLEQAQSCRLLAQRNEWQCCV